MHYVHIAPEKEQKTKQPLSVTAHSKQCTQPIDRTAAAAELGKDVFN